MTEALAPLVAFLDEWLQVAALVFVRVGAVMALLPAFGEQTIPVRVRLGLTIVFSAIVFPAVAETVGAQEQDMTQFIARVGTEAMAGLVFGLGLRLFVLALQIAGTIAAQSTSLSQIFGGSAGADPQPAMGHVLNIAGLALIALLGLHVKAAEYLILSYDFIPFGSLPAAESLAEIGVGEVRRCFALAFVLAAPFLIASLIYNVTLGVINRAMPQLMVAFVGAPAITAGGLILLLLAAPVMLTLWADALGTFMSDPFGGR